MQHLLSSFIEQIGSGSYLPHGYCLVWSEPLLLTTVISNSLIGLSYYSIPFALVYFVYRRRDLAFNWMFIMFSIFIFACGTTHFMDVWTIWNPSYWTDAGIRYLTALASFATAVMLWLLIPRALKVPSPAQLEAMNRELARQIAERKAAEEEIRQLYAELEARTAELEASNRELEAFSYSVSHDLRAPLAGIDGFSQALREDCGDVLDDTARHYLARIQANARHMGQLIDDILKLSRVSRLALRLEPVDLCALAREVVASLSSLYAHRPEFRCMGVGLVQGDPGLLRIALENLLDNAWKFTSYKAGASVELGAQVTEGETVYYLKDNGVGFDMEHARQLFNPFQRLHTDFSGTGIGLVTVKRIIERHGGRIWVDRREGEGTTFFFTLGGEHDQT